MSSSRLAKLQCLLLPILNCPVRPSNNRKAGHGRWQLLLKISRGEKSKDRARQSSDTETSHLGDSGQWFWVLPNATLMNKSGATSFLWEGKNEKGKKALRRTRSSTAPTWGTDDHASNVCQASNEDRHTAVNVHSLLLLSCTFENGKFHVYFTIHTHKKPFTVGEKIC